MTLTITHKGQITLKKEVLAHLGARPGDRIDVDLLPCGRLELRKAEGQPLSRLDGMLANEVTRSVTIEEINEIIADGWAGKL